MKVIQILGIFVCQLSQQNNRQFKKKITEGEDPGDIHSYITAIGGIYKFINWFNFARHKPAMM